MEPRGLIFDIKRDASEDGPGIRSTLFFKGCPLSCSWCHNPEGKQFCTQQDMNGKQIGEWFSVDELLYRLLQDKLFFSLSGGGVTLSGGEPCMQMDFASLLLRRLKQEQIHTAIETCGFFSYDAFREKLLPWLDLIYFDLKLIDDQASRKQCGRSNVRILSNFTRLVEDATIPVIPRTPLIPNITTTPDNLSGIAAFLAQHHISNCALMPYNPLWFGKLQRLELKPQYQYKNHMTAAEQRVCIQYFTK